ncbi:MAG TPA: hypothetical protein PKD91_16275 [Bacteroidia bacterium]|nr:hypothetical protein [Bacteroidia bacterium]
MKIKEVTTEADIRHFLELPLRIYKDDKEWIRPLDSDIEQVFDRKKNKTFRHGEVIRWLLFDERNQVIGRVAAFVNKKTSNKETQPTGGLGFFECINDQNAADELFNTSVEWLKAKGMEAVDGPINFGERDRWWGLLVDGFYEPVYCMNYNPPYYKALFENYGFKVYFEQFCYSLNVNDPVNDKFEDAYLRLTATGDYRAEHIRKSDLKKYAIDFTTIYNKAWSKHGSGKDITEDQAMAIFTKMKPVMDENLVWFAYYKNEPVVAWINLPELNQYFKHMNGKFGMLQKLLFLWLKMTGSCRKFYGIVFGVVPEHQGKGVDGLMIWAGGLAIRKSKKYDFMELQWIGDFNPKMINISKALGTKQCRTLITYRKLFDLNKPFERHKMIL